jgi:uncharacterized membrane protein YqgA involved in biofilm formation
MFLGQFMGEIVMAELTAAGGALILGIGFNLLGFGRIKVGNFLPALVLAALLAWWLL